MAKGPNPQSNVAKPRHKLPHCKMEHQPLSTAQGKRSPAYSPPPCPQPHPTSPSVTTTDQQNARQPRPPPCGLVGRGQCLCDLLLLLLLLSPGATWKLYVLLSKLTFMTAGAVAPCVGVSTLFQSGSSQLQKSQNFSRLGVVTHLAGERERMQRRDMVTWTLHGNILNLRGVL